MDSLFNSIGECCGAQVNTPKQAESPSITTLKRRQLVLKEKLSTINGALATLEQHSNSIGECCGAQVNTPKQAESITTLKRRQLELEEKLSTINGALATLEQHPDVAKVIELVARSRW